MKIIKTMSNQRSTYKYHFQGSMDNHSVVELIPGEKGVTEAWIKYLHGRDDSEVYYNLKNSKPPRTDKYKEEWEAWTEEHPDKANEGNWNLSLDYLKHEDDQATDKCSILKDAKAEMPEESEVDVKVHEAMTKLPPKQCEALRMVSLEGYSLTEAAAMLHISVQAMKKRHDKAKANFKNLYKKNFRGG